MKTKLNRHERNIGQPQIEALAGILIYADGKRKKVSKREVRDGK